MDTFSEMMKEARKKRGLTQLTLSEKLGTSINTVQSLERSKANCSHKMLVKLYRVLQPEGPFTNWAMASLERTLNKRTDIEEDLKSELRNDISRCLRELAPKGTVNGQPISSLAQFPGRFEPLTVVAGGRREKPPITRGDLLAGSASPEDLRYILSLGLVAPGSLIRTDKLIVNTANKKELGRVFGSSNLLVIGSPFVNFVARILNNYSVFRFEPLVSIRTWQDNLSVIRRVGGSELNQFNRICCGQGTCPSDTGDPGGDTSELKDLADNLRGADAAQSLKELYRPTGLVDPVRSASYLANQGVNVSHGIISLMPNPFDPSGKFFAILVAGVHLASTIAAVKALAEADFSKHPLGGVIEVVDPMEPEDPWSSWKTPNYTVSDLVKKFESALNANISSRDRVFRDWSGQELKNCLDACRAMDTVGEPYNPMKSRSNGVSKSSGDTGP